MMLVFSGLQGDNENSWTGKATVALKLRAQVNDATLTEAVKKAGFTARGITPP